MDNLINIAKIADINKVKAIKEKSLDLNNSSSDSVVINSVSSNDSLFSNKSN